MLGQGALQASQHYAPYNSQWLKGVDQGLLEPGQTTGSKNFKTPFF